MLIYAKLIFTVASVANEIQRANENINTSVLIHEGEKWSQLGRVYFSVFWLFLSLLLLLWLLRESMNHLAGCCTNGTEGNQTNNDSSESFHQELRKQLRLNEFQINGLFYAN